MLRRKMYTVQPQPWSRSIAGADGSPRSRSRTFSPERSTGKLTWYPGSRAGNISPGARMRRRRAPIIGLDQLDFSAENFSDESDAEGDISPARLGPCAIVDRKHRPSPRVRRRRAIRSLVRVPDSVAIAIVDESLVKLHPAVIAPQKVQARHRLEPEQRERHVRFHGVAMRKHIAHHQVRLRNHLLAE